MNTLLFCGLQAIDVLTTAIGLRRFGCAEANPALRFCFALFGVLPGLVILKMAVAGPMLWQLRRNGPRFMRTANVMFSAVASWNVGILIASTLRAI